MLTAVVARAVVVRGTAAFECPKCTADVEKAARAGKGSKCTPELAEVFVCAAPGAPSGVCSAFALWACICDVQLSATESRIPKSAGQAARAQEHQLGGQRVVRDHTARMGRAPRQHHLNKWGAW